MRRVAIIGAGISGLAAAEALGRQAAQVGLSVERWVFDSDPEPGGKLKSAVEQGFVVEAGPHGFLGREPSVFALIERLGLSSELVRADSSSARRYLVRGGRLQEIPMKPPAFLKAPILSMWGKARLLAEPLIPNDAPEEESVADFARRRLGPEASRVLVDAMVTGIYAGDPQRLSLNAAFPRMRELERDYGSLIRAQFQLAQERKNETKDDRARRESLHSFKQGLGTLTRRLAQIPERLQLGTQVRAVSPRREGGYRIHLEEDTVEVDAVLSTVPTYTLPQLFAPFERKDEIHQVSRVPYAPVHVVVQGFRAQDVPADTAGFGFLAPHCEGRRVLGSIWASTVFPDHAPEGAVLFRTLVGGVRNTSMRDLDDDSLLAAVREELRDLIGLPTEVAPWVQRIIRWPTGIPQYEVGHGSRVEAADALQAQHPGLFMAGNGLRGVALLDCVRNAEPMAQAIVRHLSGVQASAA